MKEPPSRRAQMRKKEAAVSRSEFWSRRFSSFSGVRCGQRPEAGYFGLESSHAFPNCGVERRNLQHGIREAVRMEGRKEAGNEQGRSQGRKQEREYAADLNTHLPKHREHLNPLAGREWATSRMPPPPIPSEIAQLALYQESLMS